MWIAHFDRWTLASWSVPTDDQCDSLEIFDRIQAVAEGNTVPMQPQVIARLSAPFGANWCAYPTSDLPLVCALGWLARGVGVFAAASLRGACDARDSRRTHCGDRSVTLRAVPLSSSLRVGFQPAGNVSRNVLPPPAAGS